MAELSSNLLTGSNSSWKAAVFKWQFYGVGKSAGKQKVCQMVLSANVCVGFPPSVFVPLRAVRPLFVYFSVSAKCANMIMGLKHLTRVPQTAELQPCSRHSPLVLSPHLPLCCRGYSRAWCCSGPVGLCCTDGPVLSLPLWSSSCLLPLCLCHVQLHSGPDISSYVNKSSWFISTHTHTHVCFYCLCVCIEAVGWVRVCHWLCKKTLLVKEVDLIHHIISFLVV